EAVGGDLKTTIWPRVGSPKRYARRLAMTRSSYEPSQSAAGFAQCSVGSIEADGMRYGFATSASKTSTSSPATAIVTAQSRSRRLFIGPDANEHLPDVVAVEEPYKRGGRVLEAVDHRLAVLQLPGRDPRPDLREEVAEAVEVVDHDEPLDAQPLRDDQRHVPRSRLRLRRVVLRDRAACRDAPERAQREQRRFELGAAHVVEVHVDAVGQRLARRRLAVVERLDAERAEPFDLLGRAGAADHAAAAKLRDLTRDRADGACGSGHVDGLALLDARDRVEPDPCGQARRPEDAERGRRRGEARIEPRQRLCRRHASVAPAEHRAHPVARGEPVAPRRHDAAHARAVDDVADLVGADVRADARHASAHVRVDRREHVAHQHLAVAGLGVGQVAQLEVALARLAVGPRGENDGAAHDCAGGDSSAGAPSICGAASPPPISAFIFASSSSTCPDCWICASWRSMSSPDEVKSSSDPAAVSSSIAFARACSSCVLSFARSTAMPTSSMLRPMPVAASPIFTWASAAEYCALMISFCVRKASIFAESVFSPSTSFCCCASSCWPCPMIPLSWPWIAALRVSASRARSSRFAFSACFAWSSSLSTCCCIPVYCSSSRFFAVVTSAIPRRTFCSWRSCSSYE